MCTLMYPRKGEGPEFLRETLKLSLSPRLLEMLLREAGLPPEYVYELGEKNLKYKEEEGRRKKGNKRGNERDLECSSFRAHFKNLSSLE